ncbi:MAG: rhomboid family intramembrane serine protease [Chloroflexota bacterium]
MLPIGDESHPGGLPIVNLVFIAVNVLVFVLLQLPSEAFTMGFSVIPREITNGIDLVGPQQIALPDGQSVVIEEAPGPSPIWLTLFTSMFMHGGWLHLGGNMLFLFVFGDNVERYLGSLKYIVFYVVCGIVAAYAQIFTNPESVIPTLGASGAISGALAAYLVFFPRNRVRVLVGMRFVTEVPALMMIGLWALIQFVSGVGAITVSEQTGGVAYWAHIGGFVAGLILAFVLRAFVRPGTTPRFAS